MMGPEELKKQRIGYVKYWHRMLVEKFAEVSKGAKK